MIRKDNQLIKDITNGSDWSKQVTLKNDDHCDVSFNRGLVASQFMAKKMADIAPKNKNL
jgi:hypothetical protein